ncbi:MAG: hypothetical protein JSS72_04425 [Armatimonadetes bacterium]|nr:hypothetical protein [Armatimonadota bacterium]
MKSKLFILAGMLALCSVALAQGGGREKGDLNVQPLFTMPYATAVGQPALTVTYGGFTARQVNVTPDQHDTVGDAAQEPAIAVNPKNPAQMAIGFIQFDSVTNAFRQAGNAWTNDGGQTWQNMPPLTDSGKPQYRTDPDLATDSNGQFFYLDFHLFNAGQTELFNAVNNQNWLGTVFAWGGQKPWLTCDTHLNSPGNGNLYEGWTQANSSTGDHTFSRSIPNAIGQHTGWEAPVLPTGAPTSGMIAVGPGGEVYDAGSAADGTVFLITRSDNAKDKFSSPVVFGPSHEFSLGGGLAYYPAVNPWGAAGKLSCQVAGPFSPNRGTVYVLSSVGLWDQSGNADATNVHVMFARSSDGGQTFSAPIRVDAVPPSGQNNLAWFGRLSVSPNGRLDVTYNSTGYSSQFGANTSVTMYTFSLDNGNHWSAPVQLTPAWDPNIGYPDNYMKIGGHSAMISALDHVDFTFTATFTGGQDVYYMRIPAPLSRTPRKGV